MLKTARVLLTTLLGIYLVSIVTLYLLQRDLMFAGSSARVLPGDFGINDIEEITLRTATGKALYSWYGRAQPGRPTILYFHGNGGSVSTRQQQHRKFMARGYGVFMLGYPGYGGSEGTPSEKAFINAAQLSYEYLRKSKVTMDNIVIFGESLGTAVAVQLAAARQAKALVLAAPMSSILEIAELQYPYVPIGLLLKDPFLSHEYIDQIRMPLLIIHGSGDEAIPISSGRKLFAMAHEPKVFHVMQGAGHNNLFDFSLVDVVDTYLQGDR